MKTVLSLLIIGFFFMGCQKSEKEIAGIYLKSPSVNVIDSLFIYTNRLQYTQVHARKVYQYTQVFYDKKTGKLLFVNKGNWWLDNGGIVFMDFFFDVDNDPSDYSYSSEAIKNTLIMFSSSFDGDDIIVDKGVLYKKIDHAFD